MKWLQSERERWLLWLPVMLVAGMALYYALPFEPSAKTLLPLLGMPFIVRWLWRRRRAAGWLALALMLMAAGFVLAKIYSDAHPVTMLERELRFATLSGRVVDVAEMQGGLKLTLDHLTIEGVQPDQVPQRVRVSLRGAHEVVTGEWLSMRAGLMPPAGAVMPGSFDFARYFYFQGIGAVGYAMPPLTRVQPALAESDYALWRTEQRQKLSRHIRQQMPPVEGAITAALMMGDRAAIPDAINVAMRNANLSHILSISGAHMAIFTGMIFLTVRYGLLLLPATRHVRRIKKIAAVVALLTGFAYLQVSGLPAPAIRAFIMVALLFGAILLDREVTPMRSLMWAAVWLLVWRPPNMLEPGFQLSFLATAALIAWYERVRAMAEHYGEREQWGRRAMTYVGGIIMTSVVAEAATAPLVLAHFNSITLYGVLANLLATPLVSFLIMPFIILAFLAMPVGLESWPLQVVEWGVSALIWVAQEVSGLPNAQFFALAPPAWGVGLMVLGVVWVMIWQHKVRWLGVGAVMAGYASIATLDLPDLMISHDAKQLAGRIGDEMVVLEGSPRSFVPTLWANGSGRDVLVKHVADSSEAYRCDRVGCVWQQGNVRVALPKAREALASDCARANLVIAPFYIHPRECQKARYIDRASLMQRGGHWLWVEDDALRIGTTAQAQGNRPWSR